MTRSLEAATTRPDRREREAGVDLHGRVALVTGGGRGVGRLLARTLAEAGAAVALIARSSDELATTVGQIRDAGASRRRERRRHRRDRGDSRSRAAPRAAGTR